MIELTHLELSLGTGNNYHKNLRHNYIHGILFDSALQLHINAMRIKRVLTLFVRKRQAVVGVDIIMIEEENGYVDSSSFKNQWFRKIILGSRTGGMHEK